MSTAWPGLKRNLVAILRGVKRDEIEDIGKALIDEGFEAIEVPLNSPDPFASIERLVAFAPSGVLVGAGTVTGTDDVERLVAVGGRLMVSPNYDAAVLAAAVEAGLVTMPGVYTPSEALAAARAGASALKFFPASALGASGIKAIRAVLPAGTVIGAVGGVSEADFVAYAAGGVHVFGLGSSLYSPGFSATEVALRARRAVQAYDAALANASGKS